MHESDLREIDESELTVSQLSMASFMVKFYDAGGAFLDIEVDKVEFRWYDHCLECKLQAQVEEIERNN